MDPLHGPDADSIEMLKLARAKAQKIIDELVKQQAEVEANPPKIAPEKLAQGRQAMTNALAAARRALAAIDDAMGIAARSSN
ncbi:MAG: hypothetical protein ACREIT_05045 [Tepidisphaeraceae bacterium]